MVVGSNEVNFEHISILESEVCFNPSFDLAPELLIRKSAALEGNNCTLSVLLLKLWLSSSATVDLLDLNGEPERSKRTLLKGTLREAAKGGGLGM